MKPQNNTTASHSKGEKLRLQFTLRVGLIREIRELLNDNIVEYKKILRECYLTDDNKYNVFTGLNFYSKTNYFKILFWHVLIRRRKMDVN